MPKLFVDKKSHDIPEGKNILEACLSLGYDLPYFCWHPAMGSVGACRQCAVKQYKDKDDDQGKIVMSCMEPVTEETYISIQNDEAKNFRKHVIEWLMTNHPHDCPTCDEGGECHLQDMTVMTGHNYRRFRFNKRTYQNQDLGPCINHEMNRCIQCYRCVRFYRDYAGGDDLNAFAAHNHVYFGRHEDGTLESPFSGNLVEVCPTGVFTDKTLKKHYTRKWDLTNAPSICQQCGLGCNIIPGERYGTLRRIQSRYNGEVNGYFICDRGRFGYEFVNSVYRIRHALVQNGEQNTKERKDLDAALEEVTQKIKSTDSIAGIGSPRASLESNHALRSLVGEKNFYAGIPDNQLKLLQSIQKIMENGPAKSPSMRECENADAVLILGEDLTHTAPMLSLSIRQTTAETFQKEAAAKDIPDWQDLAVRTAGQGEPIPIYSLSPSASELRDIATHIPLSPQEIGQMAFAIANSIDQNATFNGEMPNAYREHIEKLVQVLTNAKQPLIIAGTSLEDASIIKGAANIANALSKDDKQAWLSYVVPEANILGLAMMQPNPLDELQKNIGEQTLLLNLENDLFRILPENAAQSIFNKVGTLVALDHSINRTTEEADIILPVGSFAEADGTLVNNEGRAQTFYQVMQSKGDELESWRMLAKIKHLLDKNTTDGEKILQDFTKSLAEELPVFSGIMNTSPPAEYRKNGQKIPRQPHRYSGRTAINADKNVHEQKPPQDPDSPLSYSMEGYKGRPPSSLNPNYWSPGWNSQQAINKFQIEVGGPLHDGDPGVRLLEADQKARTNYFSFQESNYSKTEDSFTVIPTYHIFGSEYFSMQSPAINERSPDAAFTVNRADAKELGIENSEKVTVNIDGDIIELKLKLSDHWPKGVIGYPQGFPGVPFIAFPAHGKMKTQQ